MTTAQIEHAPLFDCVRDALVFAYSYAGQHYDAPAMYRAINSSGPRRVGKGLHGVDGAGQAGMVRAEVHQLPQDMQAIIAIQYAPRSWPCGCGKSCCSGHASNDEWTDALGILVQRAVGCALAGRVTHYRARKALVIRALVRCDALRGVKPDTLDEISAVAGVHRNTVAEHNRMVQEWVRQVHSAASNEIHARLTRNGIAAG